MTGARTSGGACGSIRHNSKNLTWARTAGQRRWKHCYPARGSSRGAAWLSSARVVRCWVNPATSATLVLCCHAERRNLQETASDKLEEGGDDVKSSWPLCPGLHTCYNGRYKAPLTREGEPIAKNRSQFGLQAATRLHEAGIASNGRSARCREYVPGPCTHRPSHHESGLY